MLKVLVADASGVISCVFFNQPWLEQHFRVGRRVVVYGPPRLGRDGLHFNGPACDFWTTMRRIRPARLFRCIPSLPT